MPGGLLAPIGSLAQFTITNDHDWAVYAWYALCKLLVWAYNEIAPPSPLSYSLRRALARESPPRALYNFLCQMRSITLRAYAMGVPQRACLWLVFGYPGTVLPQFHYCTGGRFHIYLTSFRHLHHIR